MPSIATIDRPSIHRLLDAGVTGRLTVICAGPGWGKTMAVAHWVALGATPLRMPVAWLTVADVENNPAGFWHGVLQAIRGSEVLPEDHPLKLASTAGGISPEVLVALHQGLDTLPEPVLLVLDDFHLIDHPDVLEAVHRMVDHDSPLHLMLLTRVDPMIPLHRLRVEGHVSELTSRDLAFDPVEIDRMGHTAGLDLTAAEIEAVLARTEGWPAGVRLATLFLSRPGGDRDLAHFTGTERSVAEYLVAEVLDRNTPSTREFLLRTAVTDRVTGDLADAIVPGAGGQAVLEALEHANQFVTALGPERVWFGYHPLLRDLLAHTLRRDDPAGFRGAHQAAATWLAAHGDPLAALGHAAAAEDWTLFTAVYTTAGGPSLVGAGRPTLARHLRSVPYTELPASVPVQLCAAGLALTTGQLDALDEHVDRARALLGQPGSSQEAPATIALLDLLAGAAARHLGDAPAAVRTGTAARAAVDAADPFPAAESYRAIAAHNRGVGLLWTGDTQGALETLAEVARHDPHGDIDITRMTARGHRAMCELIEARVDSAQHTADQVLADAAVRGWTSMFWVRPAHWCRAQVRLLRGELDGSESAVAAGLAADGGGAEPGPVIALHITQGSLAVSRGRSRAAARAAEIVRGRLSGWNPPVFLVDDALRLVTDLALLTGDLSTGPGAADRPRDPDSATPTWHASQARLLLATGDPHRARQAAARVTDAEEYATLPDLQAHVEAWLVHALAAHQAHRHPHALAALERALDVARPHHLVRPFLITPAGVVPLIRALTDRSAHPDPFTSELLARVSAPKPGGPEPAPLVEALTERELAILAELPTWKANHEIADEFYVSVNTVKAHLKGLYRKLDVTNRSDAVRRARELGLLR